MDKAKILQAASESKRQTLLSRPDAPQVLALIERLEHFIDASEFLPASRLFRSQVFLALISKALTVGRAICTLVQAGFRGEAYGMSRTLIDIFLAVRYISNKDTEARAKRFVDYFAKTHEGWTNIIEKHFPERKNMPMPDFHDEAMETAREFKSYEWTGVRGQTKMMALEGDTYERDDKGNPITQAFDYEVIYWWTSQFVHGTIRSLLAHETEPGRTFRVRAHVEKESDCGHDALFNTLMFLYKIFVSAFRGMNADQPEELLAEIQNIARQCVSTKPDITKLQASER